MLRGILRNVQYLFLFFSVLLVFLALQRLQYLPAQQHNSLVIASSNIGLREGALLSASNSNLDEPEELKSSFYYRGDEMKEIGWRSFRVGVFKFILPSFSSSSVASSSYHHQPARDYLTVPSPNVRPKSVAYILDFSTQHLSISKVKTLTKSIQRMHSGSKYEYYKIYALVSSQTAIDEDGDASKNKLSKLGVDVIDLAVYSSEGREDEKNNSKSSIQDEVTTSDRLSDGKNIHKIWKRHDIIINLVGVELHSSWNLDGLFDILLSSSRNSLRFPGVDSFLLQPHQAVSTEGREEILIFNGKSHRAFESFVKFLSCVSPDRAVLNDMSKEREVKSNEADANRSCIDRIGSNRGVAMCVYHQDFIDCSESMTSKERLQ